MPGFDPRPGAVVLGVAVAVGLALRRFGSRAQRQYAVAVAGGIIILGLDYVYELPLYAYLAGILLTPFVYHRSVRSRLAAALGALKPIELRDLGIQLTCAVDKENKHLALFFARPLPKGEGEAAPLSILARPEEVVQVEQAAAQAESLVLALDFIGELDDDYEVVVWGESTQPMSGQLLLFHREAVGYYTGFLQGAAEIDTIPGWEPWMCLRAQPPDFAFRLLDVKAFAILHELFALQSVDRQMFTAIEGRKIRIGSSRTFTAGELPVLLSWGARWIQKAREGDTMGRQ